MIAIDLQGVEHLATRSTRSMSSKAQLWTSVFGELPVASIREVRVEAQRIHWIEFRDIALFPSQAVAEPHRTRFGEVTELVVDGLLDLDTGLQAYRPVPAVHSPASGVVNATLPQGTAHRDAEDMAKAGYDLEAADRTLEFYFMAVAYMDARDWDRLSPDELRYRLRELSSTPVKLEPPSPVLPITLGFGTRQGAIGLLQILSFADDRAAATVRFKRIVR
jgi:hypothetical protein